MGVSLVAETNFNMMIPFVLTELSGLERDSIATVMSIQAISDITGRLCVPLLAHKAGWTSRNLYVLSLIGSTVGRTSTYSNVKYSKMRNRPLHGNECTICWVGWFWVDQLYGNLHRSNEKWRIYWTYLDSLRVILFFSFPFFSFFFLIFYLDNILMKFCREFLPPFSLIFVKLTSTLTNQIRWSKRTVSNIEWNSTFATNRSKIKIKIKINLKIIQK